MSNLKFQVCSRVRSPCLEISFRGSSVFDNILALRKGNQTIIIKETNPNIFCKSFKVRIFEVNCLGDEAYVIKIKCKLQYQLVTHVYPVSFEMYCERDLGPRHIMAGCERGSSMEQWNNSVQKDC